MLAMVKRRRPSALLPALLLLATAAAPAAALRSGLGRHADVPASRHTLTCPPTPATAELPPRVSAALGRHLAPDELAALAPALLALPAEEVASRAGQAAYLLDGVVAAAPLHEAALLRASLVAQPQYFSQPFGVVYEDANLLIVDKPFDTQIDAKRNGRRWDDEITVVEWLEARTRGRGGGGGGGGIEGGVGGDPNGLGANTADAPSTCTTPRPCHTLDYATSGLLIMPKTDAALAQASAAFDATQSPTSENPRPSRYRVAKEYRAVVLGWPEWEATTVRCDLEADPSSPFKMRVAAGGGGAALRPLPSRHMVDGGAALRWGPSRLPPARAMTRDGRAAKARPTLTEV
ncbi:hypothetical protein T484DRAFT_1905448, partial [Baffinella frigidus]